MGFNLSKFAGGAASGATTGASIGGPWGAVIGGVLGGGLSLLDEEEEETPDFQDRFRGRTDEVINKLLSGNLGKQMASSATGKIQRNQLHTLRAIRNTPGVGRNAAVLSKLTNLNQSKADEGIVDAQLRGAEFDTNNMFRGAQLAQSQRNFEYQQYADKYLGEEEPGFLETIGNVGGGAFVGNFLGYLGQDAARGMGKGGGNQFQYPDTSGIQGGSSPGFGNPFKWGNQTL